MTGAEIHILSSYYWIELWIFNILKKKKNPKQAKKQTKKQDTYHCAKH